MHDKSKKRSAQTLENRTRDAIVQRILDGQGSVDDIHRLPFQLRDELLQLYNFQLAMNGLRTNTLSTQEINEILQVDHASSLTMGRMYYTIPKSQRAEFLKLYLSKGYQRG
jgi:ABC-type transporter MlaC component